MHNYSLDMTKLSALLNERGYQGGFSALAKKIGVHRNTIGHFSAGNSILPKSLQKLFELLNVDGREFIQFESDGYKIDSIAFVVDAIAKKYQDCCVVLFGSRARGTNKKFSDFDLGVFSSNGLDSNVFTALIDVVEKVTEDFPIIVQLVNLNRAEPEFLKAIAQDIKFLGGSMSNWLALKGKCYG